MAVLILIAAAVVPYLNSLQGSFHFDDIRQIVLNESIHTLRGAWSNVPTRVLTFASFWLNYRLHGLEFMPGWHLVNILLHAGCVLCVYGLMRLLLRGAPNAGGPAPFLGALVFALHPLATEPVNYIVARSAIMYAAFSLLALAGAVIAHRSQGGLKRTPGGLLIFFAFGLAAVTKEVGMVCAVALPLLYVLIIVEPTVQRRKRFWLIVGGSAVVLAGAAVGWGLASGMMPEFRKRFGNELLGHHFWGMTTVFWRYVSLAMLPSPARLNVDHHVRYLPDLHPYTFTEGWVLLGSLGLLILVGLVVFLRHRRPVVALLLGIVPVSMAAYFVLPTIDIFVEYKFYLALAAVCGLGGMLLSRLIYRDRRLGWALTAAVCAVLLAGTFVRNRAWRDDLTLWRDAAEKCPRKMRTQTALALALVQTRDPTAEGLAEAYDIVHNRLKDKALTDPWWGFDRRIVDNMSEVYYRCGLYDLHMARYGEAHRKLVRAVRLQQLLVDRKCRPVERFQARLDAFKATETEAAARMRESSAVGAPIVP